MQGDGRSRGRDEVAAVSNLGDRVRGYEQYVQRVPRRRKVGLLGERPRKGYVGLGRRSGMWATALALSRERRRVGRGGCHWVFVAQVLIDIYRTLEVLSISAETLRVCEENGLRAVREITSPSGAIDPASGKPRTEWVDDGPLRPPPVRLHGPGRLGSLWFIAYRLEVAIRTEDPAAVSRALGRLTWWRRPWL